MLSPHGHVEQHWQLTELGGTVWLDVEPGMAADALKYLTMMRFLKQVELADVSDRLGRHDASPARSPGSVLRAAGLPIPEVGQAVALPAGGFVRGMPAGAGDTTHAVDLIVAARRRRCAHRRGSSMPAPLPAGTWAFDALRVQARRPRLRFETDHRTIAHEVGWIGSAVHLDKGCYRGQETVARVQNLGQPPRRLVLLHLDGSVRRAAAARHRRSSTSDGAIGFLGTAVHHHELGPIALAVIKRSHRRRCRSAGRRSAGGDRPDRGRRSTAVARRSGRSPADPAEC